MPVTVSVAAVAGVTVIAVCVPLIEPVVVSVAVTVCSPTVSSVTPAVKVFVPLSPPTKVRPVDGSVAAPSLDVNAIVPV